MLWPPTRALLGAPAACALQHALQGGPVLQAVRTVWNDVHLPRGDAAVTDSAQNFYDNTVESYALQPVEHLTLRQMLDFGREVALKPELILTSARFAQRELPKRLARRLADLQFLPHVVVSNPHIRRVYDSYHHAFDTIRVVPEIRTWEDNAEFTRLLRRLVDDHAPMLDALASGLRECSSKPLVGEHLKLDGFLDNMLRSRISRRVIAEQHINLQVKRPGWIGCFGVNQSLAEAAEFAGQRVQQVCAETYGAAPEVRVGGDTRAVLTYIPAHLDYMLYELLKNSARAVVEKAAARAAGGGVADGGGGGNGDGIPGGVGGPGARLPPVLVHICQGDDFTTFRIMDEGGGIPERDLRRVWQYGYTTTRADSALNGTGEGLGHEFGDVWSQVGKYSAGAARYRMAGLGFGLPLSRLFARYFGGDLRLTSMPGYGVDAYLHLRRLEGYDWAESDAESRHRTSTDEDDAAMARGP